MFGSKIVAISPSSISDYRHRVGIASGSFFGAESATDDWLHSERVEIICRHDSQDCAFGAVADAQGSAGDSIDDERFKQR